jgi:hypothetical protein
MKSLVVHVADPTTAFLSPIYEKIADVTIINGGITKALLITQIEQHDRILMMGHGTGSGLLNMRACSDAGIFVIDDNMVPLFRNKTLITIWCYAKQFIEKHALAKTVYTDMFVSEMSESFLMGMDGITDEMIQESNWTFSKDIAKHITKSPKAIFEAMQEGPYAQLAKINPVAKYNHERLGYTS